MGRAGRPFFCMSRRQGWGTPAISFSTLVERSFADPFSVVTRFFLDTETTGGHPAEQLPGPGDISIPAYRIEDIWPDRLPEENPWPRVVQVAWIVFEDSEQVAEESMLIRPDGFEIPEEAAGIHGITTEQALADGIFIQTTLDQLEEALGPVEEIVAHNADFDVKTLAAEYYRQGWAERDSWKKTYPPVQQQGLVGTMKSGTDLCALPRQNSSGYKWPTPQELYVGLFGETLEDLHDALTDAKTCARCFFELKEREITLTS